MGFLLKSMDGVRGWGDGLANVLLVLIPVRSTERSIVLGRATTYKERVLEPACGSPFLNVFYGGQESIQ